MPQLNVLPIDQAQMNSATGKRAQIMREYLEIIERVPAGQAGQLTAGPGETLSAIRRRLGAAARQTGTALIIKRTEQSVYFWVDSGEGRRRRGRPPKRAV